MSHTADIISRARATAAREEARIVLIQAAGDVELARAAVDWAWCAAACVSASPAAGSMRVWAGELRQLREALKRLGVARAAWHRALGRV